MLINNRRADMPHTPQVLYGFEHETMEAKVRSFLQLTPAERIKSMMEFMELTRAVAQAKPRKRARKGISRCSKR